MAIRVLPHRPLPKAPLTRPLATHEPAASQKAVAAAKVKKSKQHQQPVQHRNEVKEAPKQGEAKSSVHLSLTMPYSLLSGQEAHRSAQLKHAHEGIGAVTRRKPSRDKLATTSELDRRAVNVIAFLANAYTEKTKDEQEAITELQDFWTLTKILRQAIADQKANSEKFGMLDDMALLEWRGGSVSPTKLVAYLGAPKASMEPKETVIANHLLAKLSQSKLKDLAKKALKALRDKRENPIA